MIFKNCREKVLLPGKFPNSVKVLGELSLFKEQGAFFGIAGKSRVKLRMVAGLVGADSLRTPQHRNEGDRVSCLATDFRDDDRYCGAGARFHRAQAPRSY